MSFIHMLFNIPPIIEAAEEGNLPLVKKLIENGVDANARGMLNVTPLMSAAQHGHLPVVEYLLSLPETKVNAVNDGGTTALHIAIRLKRHAIFDAILADGRLDVNTIGRFGGSALNEAAASGDIGFVTALLKIPDIRHEANYTSQKLSPTDIARRHGHEAIAALLEKHFGIAPPPPGTPPQP